MAKDFEAFCQAEFVKQQKESDPVFFEGLEYSFFSGGKRFRPRLILSLAGDLDVDPKKLMGAALAVELVHTYSLIHDDLPAMDDDEYRRGKLSHHAKYGEAAAVLAGDALLTMAFETLGLHYDGPVLKSLILKLSQCAGAGGMVGGQVLDCLTTERDERIFEKIHIMKTAMLFEYCTFAVGCVKACAEPELLKFSNLGKGLGLLFQLQDDLLDEDKKDERAEENILSVVSREALVAKIESQKKELLVLMNNLQINDSSVFRSEVDKLFNRDF